MEDYLDIGDSTNVTGIAQLLDTSKINNNVNLDDIERNVVGGLNDIQMTNPQQSLEDYQRELTSLTQDLRLDEPSGGGVNIGAQNNNPLFQQVLGATSASGNDDEEEVKTVLSETEPTQLKFAFQDLDQPARQVREFDTYNQHQTHEQRNSAIISGALGGLQKEAFSLQKVRDDEKKYNMLSNIEQLKTALTSYKVDLSKVKNLTTDDSLEDIENLYKSLLFKLDSIRYTETGMNVLTLGVYFLEWLFDGKKKYFGTKPNLSGWHSTAAVKMQRVSYPISQGVSKIMNGYDYGDSVRVALELLPSAFIHMKSMADEASGESVGSVVTQDEVREALNEMEMQNKDWDDDE